MEFQVLMHLTVCLELTAYQLETSRQLKKKIQNKSVLSVLLDLLDHQAAPGKQE
jgi:hypothetical protein